MPIGLGKVARKCFVGGYVLAQCSTMPSMGVMSVERSRQSEVLLLLRCYGTASSSWERKSKRERDGWMGLIGVD